MKRQAVYFSAPRVVDLREEPCPVPGKGEVLVRTTLSAISSGTEMLVYLGLAPGDMAVDETITALGGSFGFPIKFGYAAVGRVEAIGAEVGKEWLGRGVFAFNPHETLFISRPEMLQPLPGGIIPEAAVFLPNMETAVSFLMDGRPAIGEQVAVVGQGVVGLLTTALLADFPLASLVTLDGYPLRREWSSRLGAMAVFSPEMLAEAQLALRRERSYTGSDLTYELSGNPQGLNLAIALTGYNGRVVIGSWYGRKPVELDLGGRFHRAHMRLTGSQVSAISPEWLGRWTKARRLDVAWEMIGKHRPERLITHRLPVERASEAYRMLDESPADAIQIVFTYPQP